MRPAIRFKLEDDVTDRSFPETLADAEVSDIDLTTEVFMFEGERLTDERADQIAADVLAKVQKLNLVLDDRTDTHGSSS